MSHKTKSQSIYGLAPVFRTPLYILIPGLWGSLCFAINMKCPNNENVFNASTVITMSVYMSIKYRDTSVTTSKRRRNATNTNGKVKESFEREKKNLEGEKMKEKCKLGKKSNLTSKK